MIKCTEFHQSLLQSLTAKHGGNQLQHTWQWDYQSASLKILFETTAQQLSTNTASPHFWLHLRLTLGQATQQLFFRTACLNNYFWVYCRPQFFLFHPFGPNSLFILLLSTASLESSPATWSQLLWLWAKHNDSYSGSAFTVPPWRSFSFISNFSLLLFNIWVALLRLQK